MYDGRLSPAASCRARSSAHAKLQLKASAFATRLDNTLASPTVLGELESRNRLFSLRQHLDISMASSRSCGMPLWRLELLVSYGRLDMGLGPFITIRLPTDRGVSLKRFLIRNMRRLLP